MANPIELAGTMDRIGVSAGGRQNMTDQRRFVRLLAFRVFDLPGERCGQPIKFFRGQPIDKTQIGRQRTKVLPGIERQITRQGSTIQRSHTAVAVSASVGCSSQEAIRARRSRKWSSSVRGIGSIAVQLWVSCFGDPVRERHGAVKHAFYGRDNNTGLVNLAY